MERENKLRKKMFPYRRSKAILNEFNIEDQ